MASPLLIKPLTSADIPKSSLLPVNYPASFFIQLTLLSARVCLVAYHPTNLTDPVAFISASLQENPRVNGLTTSLVFDGADVKVSHGTPHIEILTLGVLPAYQQQGIARLLVQQVYAYFREHSTPSRQLTDSSLIHTNVATSNVPALSFYERIGLRVASGVIRNLKHSKPSPAHKAALQFEWAWQHPYMSRHLRDSNGFALFESRRSKHLKANIQLVYQMISTHPYNTWPLHVKLFSDEAVTAWTAATRNSAPMPPGFTCSIELEGVDGKSGEVGSGRREPINVKDVSHITCLSKKFLASDISALIPRGGTCSSCNTYTLWGDIIRGSYRRMAGGTSVEIEEEEDLPNLSEDEPYASDSEVYSELPSPNTKATKRKTKAMTTRIRKPRQEARKVAFSSEGELFDFDGISSPDETPRKRGRPPKVVSSSIVTPSKQKKAAISSSRKANTTQHPTSRQSIHVSSEGELFDSDSASLDDTPLKRNKYLPSPVAPLETGRVPVSVQKRGRPRKALSVAASLPSSPPGTTKMAASKKTKLGLKDYSTIAGHTVASDSSGEVFDFGAIGSGSSEDDLMPPSPSSGPLNRRTSRSLQSKLPGRLGSITIAKTAQPRKLRNRDRGQENVDTTDLIRAVSSMSMSSQPPTCEPHYVEVSD
ncbi:hypothetical protein C0995_016046 [Termitomyces sp. Mi166|nr:hypothetical protein C0995_016046 [Termitomyces sp. Mi166\